VGIVPVAILVILRLMNGWGDEGEWGVGSGEWGVRSEKWGVRSEKWGVRSEK